MNARKYARGRRRPARASKPVKIRRRGKSAITMADLEQIADALDLPLSYFLPATERVA